MFLLLEAMKSQSRLCTPQGVCDGLCSVHSIVQTCQGSARAYRLLLCEGAGRDEYDVTQRVRRRREGGSSGRELVHRRTRESRKLRTSLSCAELQVSEPDAAHPGILPLPLRFSLPFVDPSCRLPNLFECSSVRSGDRHTTSEGGLAGVPAWCPLLRAHPGAAVRLARTSARPCDRLKGV